MLKLVAYEDRQGHFIFVKVPDEYGRYVRTNVSVVVCGCPACKSEPGEPCRGQYDRYTGSVHVDRIIAARTTIGDKVRGMRGRGRGHPECDDAATVPDQIGDDTPGVIVSGESESGTIDLRGLFK